MIALKNTQRSVKIDIKRFVSDAQIMLEELGYGDYELSIWITTDKTVKHYNGVFRNKPVPTDILSFPYHNVKAGTRIKPKTDDDKHLGDLLISAVYVFERYPNEQFYPRMQKLLCHGICHLLGYDHDTPKSDALMIAQENRLLKAVGVIL